MSKLDLESGAIYDGGVNPLAEPMPQNTVRRFLEITINHPRTAPFMRMSHVQQSKLLYSLLIKGVQALLDQQIAVSYKYSVEGSRDGAKHLHASLDIWIRRPYFIEGLIMSFVRAVIYGMPKRTHAQLTKYYYSSLYSVYKSPAILAQYSDDISRHETWDSYIFKEDPLVS